MRLPYFHHPHKITELLPRRLDELYSKTGRPSIAPEKLLRALLLQILGKYRRIPHRVIQVHPYEPAKQQVIVQPLQEPGSIAGLLEGEVAEKFFQGVLEMPLNL